MKIEHIVINASILARKAHGSINQKRWDNQTAYIVHPEGVASKFDDPVHKAVAWLHDVIEDTPVNLREIAKLGYPSEVYHAVDAITKRDGEQYLDYIMRVRANAIARKVKVEDIKYNIADMPTGKDGKKNKQRIDKYKLAIFILEN